jgi:plasmid stabilization system protein ParE
MQKPKPRSAASIHEAAFHARAIEDIAALADYIRSQNPAAAQRVRAAIYESLQDLILFPYIGRRQKAEHVCPFRRTMLPDAQVFARSQDNAPRGVGEDRLCSRSG